MADQGEVDRVSNDPRETCPGKTGQEAMKLPLCPINRRWKPRPTSTPCPSTSRGYGERARPALVAADRPQDGGEALKGRCNLKEKKMFGGLAFLLRGNMWREEIVKSPVASPARLPLLSHLTEA